MLVSLPLPKQLNYNALIITSQYFHPRFPCLEDFNNKFSYLELKDDEQRYYFILDGKVPTICGHVKQRFYDNFEKDLTEFFSTFKTLQIEIPEVEDRDIFFWKLTNLFHNAEDILSFEKRDFDLK